MTREEAIRILDPELVASEFAKHDEEHGIRDEVHIKAIYDACVLAVAALREQEQRENVWHDAKDNPPQKPGLYYGKKDDTDSMYLFQYRDGVWTMDAYPETRMRVIKWAYYNAFVQEQEERRWIPVTERMPESEGTYLVYTNRGSVYASHFYEKKVFRDDYVREPQWSQRGKVEVTHWMPLPEPPKEE